MSPNSKGPRPHLSSVKSDTASKLSSLSSRQSEKQERRSWNSEERRMDANEKMGKDGIIKTDERDEVNSTRSERVKDHCRRNTERGEDASHNASEYHLS